MSAALASPPCFAEEEGWSLLEKQPVLWRFVERPLTQPRGTFGLYADGGVTLLAADTSVVSAEVSSRYGVDDQLEVDLTLLRLTMSTDPDTGLNSPIIGVKYRIPIGLVEIAGAAEGEVPGFGGAWEGALWGLSAVHLGSFGRVDLSFGVKGVADSRWILTMEVPLALSVQIIDPLVVTVTNRVIVPDFTRGENVFDQLELRVMYSFGNQRGATSDIGIVGVTPVFPLRGEKLPDPWFGNYWAVNLELRFWFFDESEERGDFDF